MTSFNLEPILIPDLPYLPLSPSEPGYPSPAESDASALFTPRLPDQHEHLLAFESRSTHSGIVEPEICSDRREDLKLPPFACRVHSDSTSLTPSFSETFHDDMLDSDASPRLSAHVHAQSSCQPSPQPNHKARNTYPLCTASSSRAPISSTFSLDSTLYSSNFPAGHRLNAHFVRQYELEDELGSGGYGFVMTAKDRLHGREVAVKFIIKHKVPDHAWMVHEVYGKLPTEVMLLSVIDHKNVVKCLDLFEDALYFYLVQELHGSPWEDSRDSKNCAGSRQPSSVPSLTPSASGDSVNSTAPSTPSQPSEPLRPETKSFHGRLPSTLQPPRPQYARRSSHDLFECIEQSEHKRLTEQQARYVFAQIVDAVHYLDEQGVAHRDIKDENIVIDKDLKVKLIDFGSATFVDPAEERPFYNLFYGTTAYAASEILQKKPYQAAPAEVWTLGVLLSYLLTGTSPFPTVKHAVAGRIVLPGSQNLSVEALDLMQVCLDPDPERRATIAQVKEHRWLNFD